MIESKQAAVDYTIGLDTLKAATAGALELVSVEDGFSPWRLPQASLAERVDENIRLVSGLATGVRLRLSTAATRIELDLSLGTRVLDHSETVAPPAIAVEVRGELVDRVESDTFVRRWPDASGEIIESGRARSVVRLHPGGDGHTERLVTVWLPHDAEVVIHSGRADASVRVADADPRATWVHHGSSISHALRAPGPFGPWPQRAARELDLNLINLSLAGQAVLDPSVARAIAACPADLITLKLGINVINCDGLSRRTFAPAVHGFVDTIRHAQPLTPIVLITALSCPIHEDTPGPTVAGADGKAMPLPRLDDDRDARLTLAATREFLGSVVHSKDDDALFLLDGLTLFGHSDAHYLFDNLHPDLDGNDLIGERFVKIARDPHSPLGKALSIATARA
jgi:hypothetical protein